MRRVSLHCVYTQNTFQRREPKSDILYILFLDPENLIVQSHKTYGKCVTKEVIQGREALSQIPFTANKLAKQATKHLGLYADEVTERRTQLQGDELQRHGDELYPLAYQGFCPPADQHFFCPFLWKARGQKDGKQLHAQLALLPQLVEYTWELGGFELL